MNRGLLPSVDTSRGIAPRGITAETCQKWRYGWADLNSEPDLVQVAQYVDATGCVVAQKIRTKDKRFSWLGPAKAAETLYGKHLWRDGGRRVVVTEGELDALSVSQAMGNRWPVVSLANGAGSAERAFQANLEWLEQFEDVVICFDMDEDGHKAATAAANVLPPGKAKLVTLPLKDANAMLQAGKARELVAACWEARSWRPDGILEGDALWDRITQDLVMESVPFPWAGLEAKLHGLRRQEILTVCAGTGIGKTTLCRELGAHLIAKGEKVGWIGLEESARISVLGFIGLMQDKPLRTETVTDWAALRPVWEAKLKNQLACYDHFGSLDSKKLLSRIRYMAKGLGCGWICLDHLTIAVSGNETENERKDIDVLMTGLRQLTQETGVGMILLSQLKRRDGGQKTYEAGAVPRLSDLRGSAAIEHVSDAVLALARADDGVTDVHVIKSRVFGVLGSACALEYDPVTGRYQEVTCFDEPEVVA